MFEGGKRRKRKKKREKERFDNFKRKKKKNKTPETQKPDFKAQHSLQIKTKLQSKRTRNCLILCLSRI